MEIRLAAARKKSSSGAKQRKVEGSWHRFGCKYCHNAWIPRLHSEGAFRILYAGTIVKKKCRRYEYQT